MYMIRQTTLAQVDTTFSKQKISISKFNINHNFVQLNNKSFEKKVLRYRKLIDANVNQHLLISFTCLNQCYNTRKILMSC